MPPPLGQPAPRSPDLRAIVEAQEAELDTAEWSWTYGRSAAMAGARRSGAGACGANASSTGGSIASVGVGLGEFGGHLLQPVQWL